MDRFGSDKPDTRFGMELINVSQLGKEMNFKVLKDTVDITAKLKQLSQKTLQINIHVKTWMH